MIVYIDKKTHKMYAMQPITYMTGSELQAPYRTKAQPGNIQAGVALGPTSRMTGECLARHVSQPGMCWGTFSSQNTRAVDQYDPMVSGALTTQWTLASAPFNTVNPTGNVTNVMAYGGGSGGSGGTGASSASQTDAAKLSMHKKMDKATKKQMEKERKAAKKAQEMAEKQAKKASKQTKAGAVCRSNGTCDSC